MIPYFSFHVLQVGLISLQVWGFFASLGFLSALLVSLNRAGKRGVEKEIIYDILLIAFVAMMIGSKIFFLLFSAEPDFSVERLISSGGFSFLGGAIFSAMAILLYLKYKKMDILKIADVLTPGLVVSLIFIRIGCFLVYDHVGRITQFSWGIAYIDGSTRHPVSLYLILGNIVLFLIICYFEKRKKYYPAGVLFFIFTTIYSILRFFIDFARCSDLEICDSRYLGLTYTQLLLPVVFLVSVYYLNKLLKNK